MLIVCETSLPGLLPSCLDGTFWSAILRVRSHRVNANTNMKATLLRWVLSIPIVLFTLSESKSDVANEWVHDFSDI